MKDMDIELAEPHARSTNTRETWLRQRTLSTLGSSRISAKSADLSSAPSLLVSIGDQHAVLRPGEVLHVGRGFSCDIVLSSTLVARRHLVFYYADCWCVADLGSKYGSFIGGRPVHSKHLYGHVDIALGGPNSDIVVAVATSDAVSPERPTASKDENGRDAEPPSRHPRQLPELPPGSLLRRLGWAADHTVGLDNTIAPAPLEPLAASHNHRIAPEATQFTPARSHQGTQPPVASGLEIQGLSFDISGGRRLINNVSLKARRGTLTAVIGPSGAGKSTLSRLLAGTAQPSAGRVLFDGVDIHAHYAEVKTRIGMVPQDDVVHRQLKLGRGLAYAASLRLPNDATAAERALRCELVARQLGLSDHLHTRVDNLSGGQRKRASVAMELLTEPSLLLLDEPTSGLDPALDRRVMETLRSLANADRTVVVVTHSVAYLGFCDNVLILAPEGKTAYFGPPEGVEKHFNTGDWGDIFGALATDPDLHHERWREAAPAPLAPQPHTAPAKASAHNGASFLRQLRTLLVRQANLTIADPVYFISLLILPVILGILPAVVPGDAGLNLVPANGDMETATEPKIILGLLVVGAIFIGMSLTIRDLVAERAIYAREHAVGLSATAYLLSKVLIFGLLSYLSAAVMVIVSSLVKSPPHTQVTSLGSPEFELFLALGLTAWVGALVGLWLSAAVASTRQTMPILVLVVMLQLVLNGALIPVTGSDALDTVSRLSPSRWGVAAAASGIDVVKLMAPGTPPGIEPIPADPLWVHTERHWSLSMGVLSLFGLLGVIGAWRRLRARPRYLAPKD